MKRLRRILLIDDHPEDRALVIRQLRRELEDLQVLEITDAAAFKEALARENFDLVITDFKLCWSDGLKVIREIKSRRPGCPVIMITGDGSEETAAAAMKAGADEYISKSFEYLQTLPEKVRLFFKVDKQRQARRQSEARYARLFDQVPVGLYRITLGGQVLDVNLALMELLGYEDREEMLAVNARGYYAHDVDRRRWRQQMERDGVVRDFEVQLRCRDGRVIWVRNNAQAIRDEVGRIIWYEGSTEDISARKEAQEALEESEAKYRLLFESNPQPMMVYDQENLAVLEVNQAAVAYYGFSREEFLALTIKDIRPPEDVPALLKRVAELPRGLDFSGEWRHRKKSGEIMDVEIVSHGIVFNDKAARLALVKDITARKRAEEALRENERFLASVFDSIQDGLCVLDNDLTMIRVNPTMESWYQHSVPLTGKKCFRAIRNADQPCQPCAAQHTRDTGEAAARVVPKKGPEGQDVGWLEIFTFPLMDIATGKVKGVIEYVRDISARRQAEKELQDTNEFLRSLLQASAAGVVYLDRQGNVCVWNKAAAQMFGWEAAEVLGRPVPVVPENQEGEFLKLRERALRGETLTGVEAQRRKKDGSLIDVSISVAPVSDLKGEVQGTIAIITDITARKQTEEALHQKEAQLQQAQKMEAVGRLAGGVAHDFNNLLTAILGYSELLLMGNLDLEGVRLVEQIMQVADRAAVLIRQLLAFSRRQALRPVPLDLGKVVEEMEQLLRRVIGEDILLHIILTPEQHWVKADRGQLEQVIMNLAVNARDAMLLGGELFIETSRIFLNADQIQDMPDARVGAFVLLRVADTGAGIDQETQERIFEPFFTTKGPGEGTGLGLATVYGIVRQHDGWISVHSQPGSGTTFKVYLPETEIAPGKKSRDIPSLKDLRGQGERILVVEDENELRDIAVRMLQVQGYQVVGAANVAEATAIFDQEEGDFHLLFSDVVLSDQSGVQLAENLRGRKPGLKVVLASGYADHKVQWPIIQRENYPFLQKPYSLKDLLQAIAAALRSGEA